MGEKERSLPERYMIRSLPFALSSPLPLKSSECSSFLQDLGAGTANRYSGLIVAIHSAIGVQPPKLKKRSSPPGRTRWLTSEEWQRLRAALLVESPLLRQCAEFTLATGLRENNVLNLEWAHVDLRRRVAWVHADQAKGREAIGVPLNDAACAVLRERQGIHRRYVFGNPDYPLTKASNRAWYAALRRAKLRGVRWHDLRHTWASWAVMSGVRLEELMRLGGWKTYSMVLRYAHLAPEHLAEAAAKVHPVSQK